jgi:hypothetical protein
MMQRRKTFKKADCYMPGVSETEVLSIAVREKEPKNRSVQYIEAFSCVITLV